MYIFYNFTVTEPTPSTPVPTPTPETQEPNYYYSVNLVHQLFHNNTEIFATGWFSRVEESNLTFSPYYDGADFGLNSIVTSCKLKTNAYPIINIVSK